MDSRLTVGLCIRFCGDEVLVGTKERSGGFQQTAATCCCFFARPNEGLPRLRAFRHTLTG